MASHANQSAGSAHVGSIDLDRSANPRFEEEWPRRTEEWPRPRFEEEWPRLPKFRKDAQNARYNPMHDDPNDRKHNRAMKDLHDNAVVKERREGMNDEIVVLMKLIKEARQERKGNPTKWEESYLADRIEKLRIMDEKHVIVFDDCSRLQMTPGQIEYNSWYIREDKRLQREGRTRPYKWYHEKIEAQILQEKAEDEKQDALDRARCKAAEAHANVVRQEETAIRAALADYKQRFIAKHGQAEWDKEVGGTSNPLDLLVQHLEELMARPAPTTL